MKKLLLFLVLITSFTTSLQALSLESPRYKMELDTIQSDAKTAATQTIHTSLSQAQINIFQKQGFVVAQTINSPFTLHLSDASVSFGVLSAHKISTAKSTIGIYFPNNFGYEVRLLAEHPLTSFDNKILSHISCNGCSPQRSVVWNSEMTGLGYTIHGKDAPSDFTANAFRPLADLSAKQAATSILNGRNMNSSGAGFSQGEITFKIIPGYKDTYTYDTIVDIIALPQF